MRAALENNAPYHKHASARQTLDVEKNNKPSFSARGDNRIIDGMTHREICHFVEPTKELRQHYAPDVSHLNEHYITFYYKTSQAKCKHKHKQKFAQLAIYFCQRRFLKRIKNTRTLKEWLFRNLSRKCLAATSSFRVAQSRPKSCNWLQILLSCVFCSVLCWSCYFIEAFHQLTT